ncbi:MAG TPA: signal peptidase II [Streptosporangiaceae bacterium]
MQAARGKALTGQPPGEGGPGRPRRVTILIAVACVVYVADVVSKVAVVATLSHHRPVRLLGGLVRLVVLRNSGAAFSIGTSLTIVFTLIAVGVIIFIVRTARRLRSLPWAIAAGMVLGGATGNLTDRLLRSPGAFTGNVVDWIQLPHWPVFNVADSSIVCGGLLAILLAARGIHPNGTREGQLAPGGGPAGAARRPQSRAADGDRGGQGQDRASADTDGQGQRDADEPGVDGRGQDLRGLVPGGPDKRGEDRPTEDSRA